MITEYLMRVGELNRLARLPCFLPEALCSSKMGGSGTNARMMMATMAGTTPTANRPRQPNAAMMGAEASEATSTPTWKPRPTAEVAFARLAGLETSEAMAMPRPNSAPMPRPARKRNSAISSKLGAKAEHRVNTPKKMTE